MKKLTFNEIMNVMSKINELQKKISDLEKTRDELRRKNFELNSRITEKETQLKKMRGFLSLFKRNEIRIIEDEISKLNEERKKISEDIDKTKEEERELRSEIESLRTDYNISTNLSETGFQFQNGFPIISDEDKLVRFEPSIDWDNFSVDELMMVHKTYYFPHNNVIRTSHDAIGEVRNTIHTALNGMVGSHDFGNWEGCPIIVLDPLKYHIDQCPVVHPVDTFTWGSMPLSPDAIILIDAKEFSEIYAKYKEDIDKSKARIILFKGNPKIVVEKLLNLLGYKPEECEAEDWKSQEDQGLFLTKIKEIYPEKEYNLHSYTVYGDSEKTRGGSAIRLRKEFGIIFNGEDIIIPLQALGELFYGEPTKEKIEEFIKTQGIFVKDDEIHFLGTKDYVAMNEAIKKGQSISQFQIEKVMSLIMKYRKMQEKMPEEISKKLQEAKEKAEILRHKLEQDSLRELEEISKESVQYGGVVLRYVPETLGEIKFPNIVNGGISLGMKQSKSLILPRRMKGLDFSKLEIVDGDLILPDVCEKVHLESLRTVTGKLVLPSQVGEWGINIPNLESCGEIIIPEDLDLDLVHMPEEFKKRRTI